MPTLQTALLEIAYSDGGPRDGPVILLLHGWPDDSSTWQAVATGLHDAGFRTIAPMHRGFGGTKFLNSASMRSADHASLAQDALELLDGLKVDKFAVAGHDWGSAIATALAVGWPQRVHRIAMLSTVPPLGKPLEPPFWRARLQWYHWYMATKQGEHALRQNPRGFAKFMWETWSPSGWFDEATFNYVALSFDNPDWLDVTLHSYRARWDEAENDPAGKWLHEKLQLTEKLPIPALYIQGEVDGVNPPVVSETVGDKFTGEFKRVVLPGVGHFPTREAPDEVASLLIHHFTTNPSDDS